MIYKVVATVVRWEDTWYYSTSKRSGVFQHMGIVA